MDGLDTQLPDTRISSRCGIAREDKVITCTHARNRSRATARGECKSNDVGRQGMTNNTPLALFLSLLSSYVRDIRPSHQFIAKSSPTSRNRTNEWKNIVEIVFLFRVTKGFFYQDTCPRWYFFSNRIKRVDDKENENGSRNEKWTLKGSGEKVRIVAASRHFNPRIFGVSHSALFCQAVRHLAGSAVGRGPVEGHWRRSRKEKDEPGRWRTGLRKVRWEEQVAERDEVKWGRRKGVAAACLQILYRALQPPIRRFPRVHQQLPRVHCCCRRRRRLHPPLERARMVWGESGRRREADKRIALSSRNDIFDQHFHITPAEALSRITPLSYSPIFFSFSLLPLFHFLPFPPHRSSLPSSQPSLAAASSYFLSSVPLVSSIFRFFPPFSRISPSRAWFCFSCFSPKPASIFLTLLSFDLSCNRCKQ